MVVLVGSFRVPGASSNGTLLHVFFVLVMEAFSHIVGKASLAGLLFGLSVGCLVRDLLVFHLLFADDTLVLCKAD